MTSKKYDKYYLDKIRAVQIHRLLGIENNGRRIPIRCPIHNERTPSMVIYQDNSFYCYGCQAHGNNALDLLLKMGISFNEAVKELDKYID